MNLTSGLRLVDVKHFTSADREDESNSDPRSYDPKAAYQTVVPAAGRHLQCTRHE